MCFFVWYLQFCLVSTNLGFSLMLVHWADASPRNKLWTGLIPNLQVQDWRKFMFCKQVDSYSFRMFISAPILCMSFSSTLVLFWGILGLFLFVFCTKNSGKIMALARQLWNGSGFEQLENCSISFIHPAWNCIIVETLKAMFGNVLQEQLRHRIIVI